MIAEEHLAITKWNLPYVKFSMKENVPIESEEREAPALFELLRPLPRATGASQQHGGLCCATYSMPWWCAPQKWEQDGEEDQLVFSCPRVNEMRLRLRETSWSWREGWAPSSISSTFFTTGELFHDENSSPAILLLRSRNSWVVFAAKWRSLTLEHKSALTLFNPNADHP